MPTNVFGKLSDSNDLRICVEIRQGVIVVI